MRWGTVLGTAGILTGCAAVAAFGFGNAAVAAPTKVTVTTARAVQAGTFKVVLTYQLPGGPDSVITRISSPTASVVHRLRATVVRDSFLLAEPPLAQSMGGVACVQSKRRGLLSSEVCRNWTYTTADQPPPPPVLDSVIVDTTLVIARLDMKPDRVGILAGQQQQFCAFIQFRDGKVAPVQPDIPDCMTLYSTFPFAVRQASPAQVQKAAATCLTWSATGGTITTAICSTTL